MKLKEINSLVELFFKKYEEKFSNNFEKSEEVFLTSLKNLDWSTILFMIFISSIFI